MRTKLLQQRLLRYLATLALVWATVLSAEAQICTTTSDGTISSLLGTDFDPVSGQNTFNYSMDGVFANTPKDIQILPNSSFTKCGGYANTLHTYDSNPDHFRYEWLKANNKQTTMGKIYTITDSLHKLFPKGKGLPFSYKDGENAFYVSGANPNGFICGIYFPWDLFRGRHFQLSYRFFFIQADSTKQCDYWNQPYITVGAHNSSGGYSGVTTTFKSDAGDEYSWQGGGNGPSFLAKDWGTGEYTFPNSTYLLSCNNNTWVQPRVDIGWTVTYDINFVNYNTDKFDCLIYYPYLNLSNADNYRVIVDYINVKMEHLCVDKEEACPGDDITITAVDFNDDAEVDWEVYDGKTWTTFAHTVVGTQKSVTYKFPSGKEQLVFRVKQTGGSTATDLSITGGYSLEVTVNAKDKADCNPATPTVTGESSFCVPNTSGQVYKIKDAESGVSYIWTLLDPSGNDVTTKYLTASNTAGTSATLNFPSGVAEGNYTIKVYGRRQNADYKSDYATFKVSVHPTPVITINLTDLNGDAATEVCPSQTDASRLKLTAVPASSGDYTYVWSGSAKATTDPAVAYLDVPEKAYCDYVGTTPYLNAGVTATRNGCSAKATIQVPVSKSELPVIKCHNKEFIYNLAATENSHTLTLKLPTYTTQCGEEATLEVTAVGPDGKAVAVTLDKANGKFTATYALGTTTITYKVTDGCDHTATCTDNVIMKDVTGPNIDCSKIPNYETYLSYYGADTCSAYQGKGTHPELLPVITNPVLEDLDHPGEFITGEFAGRSDKQWITSPFAPGVTTITGKFTDASGNSTYCESKVVVHDDKLPVVTCPDTKDLTFHTDYDVCYATFDSLLDQIIDKDALPTAVDYCHKAATVTTKYYVKGGAFTDWTELTAGSSLHLESETAYTLQYRFFRTDAAGSGFVDTDVYATCEQDITVTDQQEPTFDCSDLSNIVASVNTSDNDVFEYASGAGSDTSVVYSLATEFMNIPTAVDNCKGNIYPTIKVTTADSKKYTIDGSKATATDELRAIEFPIGTSTVVYSFTDGTNTKECSITIKVVSPNAPVTNCPSVDSYELYADAKCEASEDWFSLDHMPTALVTYDYTTYSGFNWFTGGYTTTVTEKSQIVYPFRIKRYHYTSNTADPDYLDSTSTCTNDAGQTSFDLSNMSAYMGGNYGKIKLYTKNFKSNPACNDGHFALGLTRIVYEFRSSAGISSCEVDVLVKDTTAPEVNCYRYEDGDHIFYTTPDKCSFTYQELINMKLLGGHISRLYPTDNCTSTFAKSQLGFTRISNGKVQRYMSTPNYEIGEHKIGYYAVDNAGNMSKTCWQSIIIKDTLGPSFDCSSLDTLSAFADKDCKVTYESLQEIGLIVPTAEDDPCSPTGAMISGVSARSDGKDLTDDYPLGETVITWTFADKADNKTVCHQVITVADTSKPVFDKCGSLEDLDFYTTLEKCSISKDEVEAALGTNNATDNCGKEIPGVAGVGEKGAEPLPSEFKVGTTVVTWVFDDGNGNVIYCEQNVVVHDTVAPSPGDNCPSDITKDAVVGTCENDLGLTELTINDPCDGDLVSVSTRSDGKELSAPFSVGTTKVTYTFTDSSKNSSVCIQNITINDVTPPSLECYETANDSVEFSVSEGQCSTATDSVVLAIQEPTAFDECDSLQISAVTMRWYTGRTGKETPVLEVDASGNPVQWNDPNHPYQQGYTNIHYIFTDKAGNTDSCNVTVHILDLNKPEIDCDKIPNPKVLNPDANKCDVVIDDKFLLTLNPEQAYDVCADKYIEGLPVNQKDGNLSSRNIPTSLSSGDTLNLWWFYITDLGASAKCPQQIYVTDNQPPKFDCSSLDTIKFTALEGKCESGPVTIKVPQATDNCGNIDGVGVRSDSMALNDSYPTGWTTITWTFSDSNPENDVTCEQVVFVKGSVAPEINCDTIRNINDTIPECDVNAEDLVIKTPYAIDYCAPDSLQKIEGKFTRSDGETTLDAKFPLGNTEITWVFTDFTGTVSDTCHQTVNVRTGKNLIYNCPNDTTEDVDGVCYKEVTLTNPTATHPCNSAIVDTFQAYINGKLVPSVKGKVTYNFPLGVTKVYWIVKDTTNSLVSPIDTCIQNVQIGNSSEVPLDCPTDYADILKVLTDGSCESGFEDLGQTIKVIKDTCYGYIYPSSWLASDPATVTEYSATVTTNSYKFKVGVKDTIFWKYIFQRTSTTYDTTVCVQQVWIKDKNNVEFDCNRNLPDTTFSSLPGECYTLLDSIEAKFGKRYAYDNCYPTKPIKGVASLENGDPLPNRFYVGDTINVKWVFHDSLANSDSVVCHQRITVIGDHEPVFANCDSLNHDTLNFVTESCKYKVTIDDLKAPVAKDYCTDTDVVGIPFDKNGNNIKAGYEFPTGLSTITWIFNSKYSTENSSCEQPVWVKTQLEAPINCDAIADNVIKASIVNCEINYDELNIDTPTVNNPCTNEPLIVTNDWDTTIAFQARDTITFNWIFKDTTGTLVTDTKTCPQTVIILDVRRLPNVCDSLKPKTYNLDPGDCDLTTNELNIDGPTVFDTCANFNVIPTYTRATGKKMSDLWIVGEPDTLFWTYTFINDSSLTCPQPITILDAMPEFDCTLLPDTLLKTDEGKCTIDLVLKDFIENNYSSLAVAVDPCTSKNIDGVPTLEPDNNWPSQLYGGEDYVIDWTFIDSSLNAEAKVCKQTIKTNGVGFKVDCDALYSDIVKTTEQCKFTYTELGLEGKSVHDDCTNSDFTPVAKRYSGKDVEADFEMGSDTIYWTYTIHERTSVCPQAVVIKSDEIPFDCSTIEPLELPADSVTCSVDTLDINTELANMIPYPVAYPTCTDPIEGVFSYPAGTADKLKVGESVEVTWTFSDPEHFNNDKVCHQTVSIKNKTPEFDCDKLTDKYIPADPTNCDLDTLTISKALDAISPYPTSDALCGYPVKGVYSFPNGIQSYGVDQSLVVTWTFSDREHYINDKTCPQTIYIADSTAPSLNCPTKSIITIQMQSSKDTITIQTAVDSGLVLPTVNFDCTDVAFTAHRSDGLDLYSPFPIGNTEVTWIATDEYGNTDSCKQTIVVIDAVLPELNCNKPADSVFACGDEVPAAYSTFAEFKAAGGSVTEESKIANWTFAHTDLTTIGTTGTDCNYKVVRSYYFEENKTISCQQTFIVHDTIAPKWNVDNLVIDTTVACDQTVPDYPYGKYIPTDNCTEVTYDSSYTSTQGTDPASCDYYSYTVTYKHWATDKCGNVSDTLFYVINVIDTVKPKIVVPEGWSDDFEVSNYLKHCFFSVPDVSTRLPEGAVTENCTPIENLRVWQTPPVGDTIYTSTYVYLHYADMCGNEDSVAKLVYVPTRESIVKVLVKDTVICGGDDALLNLNSSDIRKADGNLWRYYRGKWMKTPSTILFDIYRDAISEDNLVYSVNPFTYKSKFLVDGHENTDYRDLVTKLNRTTDSGHFFYVAMDTITLCSDTVDLNITVLERPRIALDSMSMAICENDSIVLEDMTDLYNVCVNDMGSAITEQGWILGDSVYKAQTPVSATDNNTKLVYYATNFCGTTTSDSSLFISCSGSPVSYADSLEIAGSAENLELWRQDKLYTDDHLTLDVHEHYNPNNILLSTYPQDKSRVWIGEDAELTLHTSYDPSLIKWYRINGEFDGKDIAGYKSDGSIKPEFRSGADTDDEELIQKIDTLGTYLYEYDLTGLMDSASYYVLVGDEVCPATPSNVVSIDVMKTLPTAITPYTQDGLNDVFMEGHQVYIFNRYGQSVYEGTNGWNGTYRGMLADPGVYFYEVVMKSGVKLKGSIEVVKIK